MRSTRKRDARSGVLGRRRNPVGTWKRVEPVERDVDVTCFEREGHDEPGGFERRDRPPAWVAERRIVQRTYGRWTAWIDVDRERLRRELETKSDCFAECLAERPAAVERVAPDVRRERCKRAAFGGGESDGGGRVGLEYGVGRRKVDADARFRDRHARVPPGVRDAEREPNVSELRPSETVGCEDERGRAASEPPSENVPDPAAPQREAPAMTGVRESSRARPFVRREHREQRVRRFERVRMSEIDHPQLDAHHAAFEDGATPRSSAMTAVSSATWSVKTVL